MNHTQNYQLNQWVKSDKVQRVDFNADNAKIDAALGALAETSAEHTETLADHAEAIAKLGNCAIWTTSYTGNGTTSVTLNCPYPPVLVYVRDHNSNSSIVFLRGVPQNYYGNGISSFTFVPSWSRTSVSWKESTSNTSLADEIMNYSGRRYTALILMDPSM